MFSWWYIDKKTTILLLFRIQRDFFNKVVLQLSSISFLSTEVVTSLIFKTLNLHIRYSSSKHCWVEQLDTAVMLLLRFEKLQSSKSTPKGVILFNRKHFSRTTTNGSFGLQCASSGYCDITVIHLNNSLPRNTQRWQEAWVSCTRGDEDEELL